MNDSTREQLLAEGQKQARIHGVNMECAPIYAEGWAAATQAALPEVITLQPGQRALLVYRRDLTHEQADQIRRIWAERHPEIEITIAAGTSTTKAMWDKDSRQP